MGSFGEFRRRDRSEDRIIGRIGAIGRQPQRQDVFVDLELKSREIEVEHLGQITVGFTWLTRSPALRFSQHSDDADTPGRSDGRSGR